MTPPPAASARAGYVDIVPLPLSKSAFVMAPFAVTCAFTPAPELLNPSVANSATVIKVST